MRKGFLDLRHACLLVAFLVSPTALLADDIDAFGSRERSPGTLIGTLYDIKQTPDRKPTDFRKNFRNYAGAIDAFVKDGWNEAIMNRFFRTTLPLYATQIYFPIMPSEVAPKAFGVGNIVTGSQWMVHFKGQVSPPETGRYRFAGVADNWLAVAVDGQTVLIAKRSDVGFRDIPSFMWTPERKGQRLLNGELTYGNWMDLKEGVPVDLDVAFGETLGGSSCALLLFQKEGETYEMTADGFPILTLFQLTPKNVVPPKQHSRSQSPAFCLGKPWTGIP
jgi:hypothetical protein